MATAPRSIFRLRIRTVLLLLAVGMIVWSAFSYWTEYSENSARRARELLAPPLGATCSIKASGNQSMLYHGKIVEQSERWIVLQLTADDPTLNPLAKQVWIPRERIEAIEIE